MANLSITKTTASNMTDNVKDVELTTKDTDGVSEQEETTWMNQNWTKFLGIYKTIPEVKTAIDMRAVWTIGAGYTSEDTRTEVILDHINGNGKEDFNAVLKNIVITKRICGDVFVEIVRDEETDELINLKVLNSGAVRVVFDRKGIIKRYELVSRTGTKESVREFKPRKILHLSNKKVADEIHGTGDIEALEELIKAQNESFVINKDIIKKFSRPKLMVGLDTDDQAKIDAFITKFDSATNKGENLFYAKGSVDTPQVVAIPPNSTMSILAWREHCRNYFFQVVGIPQIILGSSGEFTESTAKIAYLAFEQSVEDEQREIETAIWNQLHLKINLEFPASLRNEMLSDEAKDGSNKEMAATMNPAGIEE